MTSAHRLRAASAAAALVLGAAGSAASAGPTAPASLDAAQHVTCDLADAPLPAGPMPAPPYGTAPCTGVRPGAEIHTAHGPCSMGFLISGSNGRRYVATAGHCVLGDEEGERTWAPGAGSAAADGSGKQIGTAVYAVQVPIGTNGVTDFALIQLNRGVAADPQMCHFGGPTGLATEVDSSAAVFEHVGTGAAGLRSRTALANGGLYRADYVYAHGVAYPGDSGGAVRRNDGAAVGLVTQLGYGPLGNIGINRLGPHLSRAGKLLGTALTLQTAPLL